LNLVDILYLFWVGQDKVFENVEFVVDRLKLFDPGNNELKYSKLDLV